MTSKSSITVGRRKTAVARVLLTHGNGTFTINNKPAIEYVKVESLYDMLLEPLKVTNTLGTFDVHVKVAGGGVTGQIGAIKMSIARSLVANNEEHRPVLRANGLLTRDPRMVERKKYGQPKARKRFQFSKR